MPTPRSWQYRRSLASRVTLLATMAVGLSVALLAAAAYFTVRHQLLDTLDHSLKNRAYAAARSSTINALTREQVPSWVVGAADVRIGTVSASGDINGTRADSGEPITLGGPEIAVARGERNYTCRTITTADGDFRVAAVPSNEPGVALVLAQSLDSNRYTLEKLGFVLLLFGALGVIGAALAGWGVARNGLRPVRRLTEAAEEIARTEQLDPIAVEGNDEIARLASAFNAMLAALSASRDRQRQLVADAGHELRTPLTSLRTNLDLLTQADERGGLSAESRAELMDDVRFQIGELTTLIGDLTELAREDTTPVTLEPVDLSDTVARAVERVRRRASSLHFDVQVTPWWVTGEAGALERAATNLLDNAAKWSPPLGTVSVRLDHGVLRVADQGQGIAEGDLPHVFDRFYRSAESRTMPGSG
ncbi:MAG: HAMP domain-containing sensor histidine kinase, partial [Nocardioides sp.]